MNYSNSITNLYSLIQQNKSNLRPRDGEEREPSKPGYLSQTLIKLLISFSNILKTCDGRDKLCALIQYTSKFYATIQYHAIDLDNTPNNVDPFKKYENLKNVEKSMSQGRKIFRFLKWIEEIKLIYYYIVFKDTSIRNLFKALMNLSSMFYHIFDNLVWGSNVGIWSEYLAAEIKLKNTKNSFSLIRNLIKIVLDFYKFKSLYFINRKNEEEVFEAFEKRVEQFKPEVHNKMLIQHMEVRARLRIKVIEVVHSFLRICMLVYSLKIDPFYSNLHPIFAGFCGMLHSFLSLYKALYDPVDTGKQIGSKVKSENDIKKHNKTKSRRSLEMIISEIDEYQTYERLLDEEYFKDYYLDFNKDYPENPKNLLKYKKKLEQRNTIR
jgi:hypothetical protein